MSASGSTNDVSKTQNHTPNRGSNPQTKKWLGKMVRILDKPTWLFGMILTVTGIVLFVLNGLHKADLYIAGVAAISVGPPVFVLGVFFNCLTVAGLGNKSKKRNRTGSTTGDNKNEPLKPLAAEVSTRTFFEEKGIFGVPQPLINEIEVWRKFRTSENLGITFDAGFILDGPPGTGKTTIAQVITEILGGEYFEKNCGDLKNELHGKSEKNITNLFTVPENQFRVIVIDEISGLLPKRSGLRWSSEVTEHFLGVVKGTAQKNPSYVLIGTTNNPEQLDPALVRRGRLRKFTIDNPDRENRLKIFEYHLSKISHSTDEDWTSLIQSLADSSDGCSCADITGMISDAQRRALLADRELKVEDFNTADEENLL